MTVIPICKVCKTGYLGGLENRQMLMATGYYWQDAYTCITPVLNGDMCGW